MEETEQIQKPKKPRSEKQIEAFNKARAIRTEKSLLKKQKIKEVKDTINTTPLQDLKPEKLAEVKPKKQRIVQPPPEESSEEEEEEIIIRKKANKPKKKTIIYEESSSEEDEYISRWKYGVSGPNLPPPMYSIGVLQNGNIGC